MKLIACLLTVLMCSHVSGGKRKCRVAKPVCQPVGQSHCVPTSSVCSTSSGPTTKYFKAKDGTIREVMTHWEALHRAVDADNYEIELRDTKASLAAAEEQLAAMREELAALQAESEAKIAAMQQSLAETKAGLDNVTKAKEVETQRATEAEQAKADALKKVQQGRKQLRDLKQKREKAEATVKKLEGDLKASSEERAALQKVNDELQKELQAMKVAADNAAKELQKTQEDLEKLRQDAKPAEKAEIAEEPAEEPSDKPAEDEQKAPETAEDPGSDK